MALWTLLQLIKVTLLASVTVTAGLWTSNNIFWYYLEIRVTSARLEMLVSNSVTVSVHLHRSSGTVAESHLDIPAYGSGTCSGQGTSPKVMLFAFWE